MIQATTQKQQIAEYINTFGSITPMQAFGDLGITKLATRVSEMKKVGYTFKQTQICTYNRYGKPVRFMKYEWKDEQ